VGLAASLAVKPSALYARTMLTAPSNGFGRADIFGLARWSWDGPLRSGRWGTLRSRKLCAFGRPDTCDIDRTISLPDSRTRDRYARPTGPGLRKRTSDGGPVR